MDPTIIKITTEMKETRVDRIITAIEAEIMTTITAITEITWIIEIMDIIETIETIEISRITDMIEIEISKTEETSIGIIMEGITMVGLEEEETLVIMVIETGSKIGGGVEVVVEEEEEEEDSIETTINPTEIMKVSTIIVRITLATTINLIKMITTQ